MESLRDLLERVQRDGGDPETVLAVERTRPRGFVERATRRSWRVTDAGEEWLRSGDNAFLIGVFHSEIRFVGELLAQLENGPLTHGQLLDQAKSEYDLIWNSPDQVRRRTTWLRCAGFVELNFDNYLSITSGGRAFVARLENHPPSSSFENIDHLQKPVVELGSGSGEIREFLDSLSNEKLRERRRLIGYMPGSTLNLDGIKSLVTAASPSITKADWSNRCQEVFDVSHSSAMQALGSFRGAGLLQQVARDSDSVTPLAAAWLESDLDLDLIRLMHGHIRFFGEILAFLQKTGSAAELASKALEFNIPVPDLQRRINLLIASGLIAESVGRRFQLTALGQALVHELPLEAIEITAQESIENELKPSYAPLDDVMSADRLQSELRTAARAASDFTRLERAVASAFSFLGFNVRHIGGQGRTDVRASAPLSGGRRFVVIADAKASAKGQVASFDVVTLREHKEQHNADYVVAVGESFSDKRTIDRAKSEGVGLLPIGVLCDILDLASEGLIGSEDIRILVSGEGLISDASIKETARANRRILEIYKSVLAALAVEAVRDDEVTNGALSPSDIYMELRNQVNAPSLKEIEFILDFLASPLVRSVSKLQEKYVLAEHVSIVCGRLRQLSITVGGASAVE
ncbi:hypothetical protein ACQP1G_35150 [Nocardia sp. CA-107356]|uniref:hypothetical protein n=1 Tax=Nocardia sp. CA-107356 TaxID=3239972 RepID=UPI003D8B4B16